MGASRFCFRIKQQAQVCQPFISSCQDRSRVRNSKEASSHRFVPMRQQIVADPSFHNGHVNKLRIIRLQPGFSTSI